MSIDLQFHIFRAQKLWLSVPHQHYTRGTISTRKKVMYES